MLSIPLYSLTSGILKAWPIEYDPGLVTLSKTITNRDWKVTRLILSSSRISELYSLTPYGTGLQSQGLEHLCEAPISSDYNLTSLNVGDNWLGDEEIIHWCNALISVNCKLTNSTVTGTFFRKTGLKHLCDAPISPNIKSVKRQFQ